MRMAMVRVDQLFETKYKDRAWLLATVHDQILGEVQDSVGRNDVMLDVKNAMELKVQGWDLPLEVEFELGANWGDAKKSYYELPGVTGLELHLPASLDMRILKGLKKTFAKFSGSRELRMFMGDKQIPVSNKILATEDFRMALNSQLMGAGVSKWY
jgi:hypothetical protein